MFRTSKSSFVTFLNFSLKSKSDPRFEAQENGNFHEHSVDYGSNIDSDDGMDQDEIKLNYRDFGTIDWFRELALDQKRHRKLKDRNNKTSTLMNNFWGKFWT